MLKPLSRLERLDNVIEHLIDTIDPSVRSLCRLLNKHGVETKFSCSGIPSEHVDSEWYRDTSEAYLAYTPSCMSTEEEDNLIALMRDRIVVDKRLTHITCIRFCNIRGELDHYFNEGEMVFLWQKLESAFETILEARNSG